MLDRFVFTVVAATVFTFCMCHWLLDINHKYTTDMTGLIIDVNHVFFVGAIASLYYLFRKGRVQFDFALALLLVSMALAAVIDYHNENYVPVNYAWILPIAYILGKLIVGTDKGTVNKKIVVLYFVMAAASYIQSMLDFGVNWKVGWAYGTEHWIEFWTGVIEARTTYEMGFILTTSSFAFAILILKKHKVASFIIIVANVVLEYVLMNAQGRQNPVMLVLTVLMVMCLYAYDHWSRENKRLKRIALGLVVGFVLFIFALVVMFSTNAFGLMDAYKNSYWADGGFLKNERFAINWTAFQNMMQWPIDDYEVRAGLSRGHSMVLEYGRTYDFTVYLAISLIRIIFIVNAIKLALNRGKNSWIKYLIFPAFVCMNLYYTMEPNAHAHRYLWMPGLFISGMIAGWLELEKTRQVSLEDDGRELVRKAGLIVFE